MPEQVFQFRTAGEIDFGEGRLERVPELIRRWTGPILIVRGRSPERAQGLLDQLEGPEIVVEQFTVPHEPTLETVLEGVEAARQMEAVVVVGIGGGSVLDTAKAVSGLATNPGEPTQYLEVVGEGLPLQNPSLPCVAIPTTAGTGAEVTRNAVIGLKEHARKVSLRSDFLLPNHAVVDPLLTHSAPPKVTAFSGLDALTQVLEPFLSRFRQPFTDLLCQDGIRRAGRSLREVCADGANRHARKEMALVSLYGGLALTNAGLGAVHGLAGPLGGMLQAPHGAICARLLPVVFQRNLQLVEERADQDLLARFDRIGELLQGHTSAGRHEAIDWLYETVERLGVPGLGELGLTIDQVPEAARKSQSSSSMQGNPVELDEKRLSVVLREAF